MPYIDCSPIVTRINSETRTIMAAVDGKPDLLVLMPTKTPAAISYYRALNKQRLALGIDVRVRKFSPGIDEEQLLRMVDSSASGVVILSEPSHLHGVRDQLPGFEDNAYSVVNVEGDDHNDDISHLFCTARACWEVIKDFYGDIVSSLHAVGSWIWQESRKAIIVSAHAEAYWCGYHHPQIYTES